MALCTMPNVPTLIELEGYGKCTFGIGYYGDRMTVIKIEHTAKNSQNWDFRLVESSNSRPLIGQRTIKIKQPRA